MLLRSFLATLLVTCSLSAAEPESTWNLWKGTPPGDTKTLPPEADMTKDTDGKPGGKRVIRLGNVSTPTVAVYKPKKELDKGIGVVVAPGGGFNILAYDLEGTETAEWLNSQGITAFVLKYRVPFRDPNAKWLAPVQDAQRAVSMARAKAKELNITKVGILGYSAGGITAGRATLMARQYEAVDEADKEKCTPDFAILVYPGQIADPTTREMPKDVVVTKDSPPVFLVHANDDNVSAEHSVNIYLAYKKVKASAELHVYADGGHGYGLRKTEKAVTNWPVPCVNWMKTIKVKE